jgi:hypothetical protein
MTNHQTEQEQHEQLSLFFFPQDTRVAVYDSAWDKLSHDVGGQVITDTKKTAPQHDRKLYDRDTVDKSTHWVEKYWVERISNKYWYYRYCWMEGRKISRIYIGAVASRKAQLKKQAVEDAILDGQSPQEIKQLIRGFKNQSLQGVFC